MMTVLLRKVSASMCPGFLRLLLLALGLTMAAATHAADIPRENVRFATGSNSTTIAGGITGEDMVDYVVAAVTGETLIVSMTSDNSEAYFSILAPGQDHIAFFTGAFQGNNYVGQVTEGGDYKIRIHLTSDAIQRNDTATYSLSIQVRPGNDGDGLQGGPDFWRVDGESVNLHSGPSAGSDVVTRMAKGSVLRSFGCALQDATRWCRVETTDGSTYGGWVRRSELVESRQTATGGDASQPSTRTQRVRFLPGSNETVLKSTLGGGEAVNYVVSARNGQLLSIDLDATQAAVGFNILLPDGAMLYESASSAGGNRYRGELYIDGDYTIAVYSTAPRDSRSDFELDVTVD